MTTCEICGEPIRGAFAKRLRQLGYCRLHLPPQNQCGYPLATNGKPCPRPQHDASPFCKQHAHLAQKEEERQEFIRMRKTPSYKEYLRSERWQTLRAETIRQARGRCQICNRQESLQVHHRTYKHINRDGEYYDLIAVCGTCHRVIHSLFEYDKRSGVFLPFYKHIFEYVYTNDRHPLP